jgi:hypothetical protein
MKPLFVGLSFFFHHLHFLKKKTLGLKYCPSIMDSTRFLPEQLVFAVYHLQQIRMACR